MDGAAACRHSLRAARACLFVAAALACALGTWAQPAAAQAPAERYGVTANGIMDLPPESRDRHLAAIAAGGLRVLRLDAAWVGAEPEAPDAATGEHRYRWERYDGIAGAFARHGLRWYPILDYSTEWGARVPGDLMSPPADPAQFAAYARAFAARYGESGAFWSEHPELPRLPVAAYEIWNEPNAEKFWRGQATAPEDYAELYLLARRAIREVDARTPVVTGGLLDANATDPNVFVRRMVRHRPELVREIDAVGYHPYQQSYAGARGGIARIRATMDDAGLKSVPLEVTEIGATTAWVTEATRADMIARLARDVADPDLRVTRYMPFTWLASEHSEHHEPRAADFEHFWGMVRRDGTPLPTATAYLSAVRAATSAPEAASEGPAAGTAEERARTDAAAPAKPGATPKRATRLTKAQRRRIARRMLLRKRLAAARYRAAHKRKERRVLRRSPGFLAWSAA